MKKNSKILLGLNSHSNLPSGLLRSHKASQEVLPVLMKGSNSEISIVTPSARPTQSLKIPSKDSMGLLGTRTANIRRLVADKGISIVKSQKSDAAKENALLKEAVTQASSEAESLKKSLNKFGELFSQLHEQIQDGRGDLGNLVALIRSEIGLKPKLTEIDRNVKRHKRDQSHNKCLKSPYYSPVIKFTKKIRAQKRNSEDLQAKLENIKDRFDFTLKKLTKK